MKRLYEVKDVWRRNEDGALSRYRVLQSSGEKRFGVLSRDFFYPPYRASNVQEMEIQLLELLGEESPETRIQWFSTVV